MGEIEVTLMNKNTPVMLLSGTFERLSEKTNLPVFVAKKVEVLNRNLLPIYIFREGMYVKQFNEWMSKRLISPKRKDVQIETIEWKDNRAHYFSLSDQYWIRYDETEKWDNLNFFTNNYPLLTGDTLFTKNEAALKSAQMYYNTPDLATNGLMKKRWKKDKKNFNILVKHSSQQFKQEVLNEILASKLLSKLKMINYVEYRMCIEGYDVCCYCRNFVTADTEFVPAFHIYSAVPYGDKVKEMGEKERTYSHLIEAIDHFKIPEAKDFIDKMLIVDQMMMNDDRHLGNFGFLRNVNTGEFIEPAPLFDFGNSFFADNARANKTQHIFKDRIDYLFNNKAMQPLTNQQLIDFKNSISDFSFLTDKEKNNIFDNLARNNEMIKNRLLENEVQHTHNKKNVNLSLEDSF